MKKYFALACSSITNTASRRLLEERLLNLEGRYALLACIRWDTRESILGKWWCARMIWELYLHRGILSWTTTFGKRIRAHWFWVPGLLCCDWESITFDCLHTLNFLCALCGKVKTQMSASSPLSECDKCDDPPLSPQEWTTVFEINEKRGTMSR
jgi:hypothetical protein